MLNDLKSVIERIYIKGEKSFFIDGCNKSLDFVDENVVSFMRQKGYTRLKYFELEEVIPTVKIPADSIFGTQMTVETAIFKDVWELYSQVL